MCDFIKGEEVQNLMSPACSLWIAIPRYCIDRCLNVLVERGAPLFVDPNVTFHRLRERDVQIAADARTSDSFCLTGMRLHEIKASSAPDRL